MPAPSWLGGGDHDSGIHFGFRQNSFWNLYSSSAPFVDNNYNPRVFLYADAIDLFMDPHDELGDYKWYHPSLKLTVDHESNGRDGPESRSWNRLIAGFDFGDPWVHLLHGSLVFWRTFGSLESNPRIKEMNGRGELRLYWQPFLRDMEYGTSHFGLSAIARLAGHRAVPNAELSVYWNPWYEPEQVWSPSLMVQLACGSGHYLLNYTHDECAFRFGAAFIQ